MARVVAFLEEVNAVKYVASSAPIDEIERQLDRHHIGGSFAGVFGHPDTKTGVLRTVEARHPTAVRVFFGDALADRCAAATTGTRFLAINPHPALAATGEEQFDVFRDGRGVLARIEGWVQHS